jgi:hypothetical protein
MLDRKGRNLPGAAFIKWPGPGPKYGEPIWGENGPNPGEKKDEGYNGGVWGNAPSVNAGIDGVIGGRRPWMGERGPAKGNGGGMVIRDGGEACGLPPCGGGGGGAACSGPCRCADALEDGPPPSPESGIGVVEPFCLGGPSSCRLLEG